MKILFKLKVLGLRQIAGTIASVYKHGFKLLALLDSVKNSNPNEASVKDDQEEIYYKDLYAQSVAMACLLSKKHGIYSKSKVVIVSANSVAFVKSLFAVSGLGGDIFLLNPNQKEAYFSHFLATQKIDLIIGDTALAETFASSKIPFFDYNEITAALPPAGIPGIVKRKRGNITILSSGSKGKPKAEKRKVSALKYLAPLIDIIEKLQLKENRSVLISVPIFHGYGLAALFLSFFMAQKISLTQKFDAENTLRILQDNYTDCWIAVPLMIQKVFSLPNLKHGFVKNIISGGDVLPTKAISHVHKNSSAKIYNMYGTSETGVCTIATNKDLLQYPTTIGKAIKGVKTKLTDTTGKPVSMGSVGEFFVKCAWSADINKNSYISTGDLLMRNAEGYYFYKGRRDDLMVIGGENVYPVELENIIYDHNAVQWVKAKSFTDENHITKIHVNIVLHPGTDFSMELFVEWIAARAPKYMIPKLVTVLDAIPTVKLM